MATVGTIQVPAFLGNNWKPSWKNEPLRDGKNITKTAIAALVPVFGWGALICAALADSREVALAKAIQAHIVNLETTTTFDVRHNRTLQALRTLKALKAQKTGSNDMGTINAIILNLSGQAVKGILNDIETFRAAHGHNAGHGGARIVNNAAIANYGYQKTVQELDKVNKLFAKLDELDDNDLLVAFEKTDYTQTKQNVDGLDAYKAVLEGQKQILDNLIDQQKIALKTIIRKARRGIILPSTQHQLSQSLGNVRTALLPPRPNLNMGGLGPLPPQITGSEAFKALGMKGYGDNVPAFLDGVQNLIDTGYAAGDISDSELGRLSRQKFSLWDVAGGGAGATLSYIVGSAGITIGAPTILASGATAAGCAIVGAISAFAVNYFRGGGFYQWMQVD